MSLAPAISADVTAAATTAAMARAARLPRAIDPAMVENVGLLFSSRAAIDAIAFVVMTAASVPVTRADVEATAGGGNGGGGGRQWTRR